MMVNGLLPPLAVVGASCWLYAGWRGGRGGWWALVGWGLAIAGMAGWWQQTGGERGIGYGLLLFTVSGWLLIAVFGQWRPYARQRLRPSAAKPSPAPSAQRGARAGGWQKVGRWLVALPLAAVASYGAMVHLLLPLPWAEIDRLVTLALMTPLLWALVGSWVMIARAWWWPSLLLALAAASLLLL